MIHKNKFKNSSLSRMVKREAATRGARAASRINSSAASSFRACFNISIWAYASAGTPAFSLLDRRTWYVIANFSEGEIRHMARGAGIAKQQTEQGGNVNPDPSICTVLSPAPINVIYPTRRRTFDSKVTLRTLECWAVHRLTACLNLP
jgi:hypothetical protein